MSPLPFARRPASPLITAHLISNTGSTMTALALPWFVLVTTGSPARAGWVIAVQVAAMAIFGLPGGAVAQRLGSRKVMLICDPARALLVALVPALQLSGGLTFSLLLALVFLVGMFYTPYLSAQQSLLPDLLGEDGADLAGAQALLLGATRLTNILGPAIGGVLIAALNPIDALIVDAVSYAIAFMLILILVPSTQGAAPPARARTLAGLTFIARDRLLRGILIANSFGEFAFQSLDVIVPILVLVRFGQHAEIAGAIMASWAAGAVLASPLVARLSKRLPLLRLVRIAAIGQAVPLWFLAPAVPPAALAAAMFVFGLFNPLSAAPNGAIRLMRSPAHLRTTVSAAWTTVHLVIASAALAGAGPAVQCYGLPSVLVGVAALMAIRAGLMWPATSGAPDLSPIPALAEAPRAG
jgi:predicted MFS family arabinose efflux permease